jgi:hypothetical protein
MRHRRSRSATPAEWPPLLRQIVESAELECPRGHSEALVDLTSLALRKVPARGIFDPAIRGEHDLFAAIESAALTHLDLAEARAGWRSTLDSAALPFDRRDDIERAAQQVQSVSDTAYFYAGLAFGLTFVCAYRTM